MFILTSIYTIYLDGPSNSTHESCECHIWIAFSVVSRKLKTRIIYLINLRLLFSGIWFVSSFSKWANNSSYFLKFLLLNSKVCTYSCGYFSLQFVNLRRHNSVLKSILYNNTCKIGKLKLFTFITGRLVNTWTVTSGNIQFVKVIDFIS